MRPTPAARPSGSGPGHSLPEAARLALVSAGVRLDDGGSALRLGGLLPGGAGAALRHEGDWLVGEVAPPRPVARRVDRLDFESLQALQERLPLLKLVRHGTARAGRSGAMFMRFEVPLLHDESEGDLLSAWVARAIESLQAGRATRIRHLRMPPPDLHPGATAGDPASHRQAELLEALTGHGWRATATDGHVRVELRNPNGGFRQASIDIDGMARIRLDLTADLPIEAPTAVPRPLVILLVRTAGAVRLVRPFGREGEGLGFEVRLPLPWTAATLDLGLASLSLAASMSASEVEALLCDPTLALAYGSIERARRRHVVGEFH